MGPSDHGGETKSDKGTGRRLEGQGGSWGRGSQERLRLVRHPEVRRSGWVIPGFALLPGPEVEEALGKRQGHRECSI